MQDRDEVATAKTICQGLMSCDDKEKPGDEISPEERVPPCTNGWSYVISQLGNGSFASIAETSQDENDISFGDDSTAAADTTVDADETAEQLTSALSNQDQDNEDDHERERQRILEAAFAEEEGSPIDGFEFASSTEQSMRRGKVTGRSRVLGEKQISGLPSLQELCIY